MITRGTAKPPQEEKPYSIEFIEFHEAPLQDGEYTGRLPELARSSRRIVGTYESQWISGSQILHTQML